ncbi:MAG: hypothetical protein Tsb0020_02730 [Haliangiales bacterium]
MEEQGKRLFLAVVIAFVIMMGWSYLFPPEAPDETAGQDQAGEVSGAESATTATADEDDRRKPTLRGDDRRKPRPADADSDGSSADERPAEERYEFKFEKFQAEFTSYGGALRSWTLLGDKYRVDDSGGELVQLDLVQTSDEELLPFRIGFDDFDLIPDESVWEAQKKSDTEIEFRWAYTAESEEGAPTTLFEIVKSYRLDPDNLLLELTVDVKNINAGDEKLSLLVSLYGYQDPSTADEGGGWFAMVDASWRAACLVDNSVETIPLSELTTVPTQKAGPVQWVGLSHGYFLVAAAPQLEGASDFACRLSKLSSAPGVMRTDLVFPALSMEAGDPPMRRTLVAYLGPKYLDRFESIAQSRAIDPGFTESIDFGWFGVVSRPLLWLLQMFYSLVGNWGIAIIFLTIVVKLMTLYWTTKSMRSMKKMSHLRPKIEALQKKYKDDRQRQQVEMMNLYKAHGVNPMAGCLPMLLQMPIWFALYRMLMAAAELYHEPLIVGWINDLTAPDPTYVLPVFVIIMMFFQAKLSPTTADSTQQKIMMYGLPLSFGVFSFFLPSGLTLYILTNTILTTIHQFWMNRTDPDRVVPVAKNSDASSSDKATASAKASSKAAKAVASAASSDDDDDDAGQDASASGSTSSKPSGRSGGKGKRGGKKRGGKSRRR